MQEFHHLMHEADVLHKENDTYGQMLTVANNKIERQEVVIMELQAYIKWMHGFLATMDKELGVMNDGPVTAGGPVAEALDRFDKFI